MMKVMMRQGNYVRVTVGTQFCRISCSNIISINNNSDTILISRRNLKTTEKYKSNEKNNIPKLNEKETTAASSNTSSSSSTEGKKEEVIDNTTTNSTSSNSNNNNNNNTETVSSVDTTDDIQPIRWIQPSYNNNNNNNSLAEEPIIDANGQYIVSKVQWPTGEIAYTTPPPPDGKLAPRFGYNIVQVKKPVSWWKHYQKYPRISVAYINIQVLFLLGAAWLLAFLTEEYRRITDEMKTPGAMVGEHRGRGPVDRHAQKVAFSRDEMSALVDKAQNNWLDAKAEANYIGSKDYNMKKIPRPKEFSVDDFRKR